MQALAPDSADVLALPLAHAGAGRALVKLYKRYKRLGGHFVTIGSDAHREVEVGRRLTIARDIAEAAGLTPVYFKERQRVLDR